MALVVAVLVWAHAWIPSRLYLHWAVWRTQVHAEPDNKASSSTGPGNLLQRLGRVLKDKASSDFDRFVAGTSKTRERLGVRALG
jgi:hypothetical protein